MPGVIIITVSKNDLQPDRGLLAAIDNLLTLVEIQRVIKYGNIFSFQLLQEHMAKRTHGAVTNAIRDPQLLQRSRQDGRKLDLTALRCPDPDIHDLSLPLAVICSLRKRLGAVPK